MENTNLAIRKGLKLELVSHIGHNCPFLRFYADIEVVIKGLKTKHPIFVIKARDQDLILGQLF